jgi:phospholipase C
MADITRRRLLKGAATAAGGAAAASLLPPNVQRVLAGQPKHGSVRDIEHVVVLMQENRSFDHYFGTLRGVRGFDDPDMPKLPNGRSVLYQPDPKNPDGYLLPFHLDTRHTSAQAIPSTSHAWTVQHSAWNGGKMDNWLPAHREADGDDVGPYTMGYYERADIPFQFALAEAFTICDGYFCSLLGPTWPNRLYLMSGTIDPDGHNGGPIISNVVKKPYTWTTYPERLTQAGVSWRVYQAEDDYGCNVLEFFQAYQDARPGTPLHENGLTISPTDRFERDALAGKLPTVSWIIPTSGQSEHPAYLPASGADFVASKLDAVAADPDLWAKTVFILNYDENDGLFDHVPPPVPPPGTPQEFVDGLPIGGGIRVPCFVVSPWSEGGWVSSEPFDHTSVLQLLEQITGVPEPNISAWRRKTFGDLTSALGMRRARRFPSLPGTKRQFWIAEREVATLPPATFPGADQTPPHQERGRRPHEVGAPAARVAAAHHGRSHGELPRTASRLEESSTSHRADFPDGTSDSVFPGILAAVGERSAAQRGGERAYVPGVDGGNVAVVDTTTHAPAAAIKGLTNPYGIAATPDGAKLYVTNSGTNTVSVIDVASGTISKEIVVGVYPHGVAVSPDGTRAYVANTGPDTGPGGSRTVSAIDTASDAVTATFEVGQAPQVVAVSPDGATLYVTVHHGLAVVDAASGRVRTVRRGLLDTHGVAVAPDGASVWVAVSSANAAVVLDSGAEHELVRVAVGRAPWNVALTADGARAYVTNANDDTVSVIDTSAQAVVATVAVGHIPTGVSVSGSEVWVANNTSSTLSVIDAATNAVTATIDLGLSDEPTTIAFA